MKKGFTLAEVLITLAIIGVVAALTIPVVVQKYQQKQLYTQFMKAYNTMSTAYQLSVNENGAPNSWVPQGSDYKGFFEKYFMKYLNSIAYCTDNPSSCGSNENIKLSMLSPSAEYAQQLALLNYNMLLSGYESFAFGDGSIVMFVPDGQDTYTNGESLYIDIDVNGVKKPNIFGRDIFRFKPYDYQLIPNGASTLDELINSDDANDNCTTSKLSLGTGCAKRLLLEGKMTY